MNHEDHAHHQRRHVALTIIFACFDLLAVYGAVVSNNVFLTIGFSLLAASLTAVLSHFLPTAKKIVIGNDASSGTTNQQATTKEHSQQ